MPLRFTVNIRSTLIFCAILGVVGVTLGVLTSTDYYAWQQKRMVRRVLAADPRELVAAGRALIASQAGFVGEISPSSPDVPRAIRKLKPTRITVTTNSLSVDFSDVFNPFGITIYVPDAGPRIDSNYGSGPDKWIDGLWLYDDGQLENQTNTWTVRPASSVRP